MMFLLVACSEDINITLESNINLISTEDGLLKILSQDDPEYQELEMWLNKNNSGWEKFEYNELPNKYAVSGDDFFIVWESNLILGRKVYVDKSNYHKKIINQNELMFLK